MKGLNISKNDVIMNISAGFDETSELLLQKFPGVQLEVFDFYDPELHTEPSIKRARKAYPAFNGKRGISTSNIPLGDDAVDVALLILTAHEIRKTEERLVFFKEVSRVLKSDGNLVVVEHLRDLPNFLAYTIGVFHFFSRNSWMTLFEKSNFELHKEIKITPFISTFILRKHGTAS
jgi:ubiquinone/menaquinone biosynthesis C-methylase UbiE